MEVSGAHVVEVTGSQPARSPRHLSWRPTLPVLLGLAMLGCLLVPSTASGLPTGPGSWGRVGYGAHPGDVSLNASASTMNSDHPAMLLVGGSFTDAGGEPAADRIASWDGLDWNAVKRVSSGIDNGIVQAIAYDPGTGRIFAGGTFQNAGGNLDADFLAVWNGPRGRRSATPRPLPRSRGTSPR